MLITSRCTNRTGPFTRKRELITIGHTILALHKLVEIIKILDLAKKFPLKISSPVPANVKRRRNYPGMRITGIITIIQLKFIFNFLCERSFSSTVGHEIYYTNICSNIWRW